MMVEELIKISGEKTPLIYCWRGGLRSLSFYQILYLAGIPALRLKGGYKAYRKYVYKALKNYSLSPKPFILHGLTGTGKTTIIQKLQKNGYPAVDLQYLALHRGSVFGKIGYKNNRSQKDFEALLICELNKYKKSPFILLEKEGKKIGPVILPGFLTDAMEEGVHILLEAPLEIRAERILGEYMKQIPGHEEKEQFIAAIKSITPYLGKEKVKKLIDLFREENYYDVVTILCRDYYDKLYKDARRNRYNYEEVIDTSSIEEATAKIAEKAKYFKMKEEVKP